MDIFTQFVIGILVAIIGFIIEYKFFARRSPSESRPIIQVNPSLPPTPQVVVTAHREVECSRCHLKNSVDNAFCARCGTELYELCPKCRNRKPLIEPCCSHCGKNPAELRRMEQRTRKIFEKAAFLGICTLVVALRTFTMSSTFNWIDLASFFVVILGFVGLGWEALEDAIWIYETDIWRYRQVWTNSAAQNIIRSSWILVFVTFVVPFQAAYVVIRLIGWIKWLLSTA